MSTLFTVSYPELVAAEREKLNATWSVFNPQRYWDGLFRVPVVSAAVDRKLQTVRETYQALYDEAHSSRAELLEIFAACADSQRAWLLLEDYFEKLKLSMKDFAGADWWPRMLKVPLVPLTMPLMVALFAVSGAATPSIAPLPKRDGSFAIFFSTM